MSRRARFTDRRRRQLAVRLGALEALEPKAMITESLGIMIAGIGVPAALSRAAARPPAPAAGEAARPRAAAPHPATAEATSPHHGRAAAHGGAGRHEAAQGGAATAQPVRTASAGHSLDWLTLVDDTAGPAVPHRGHRPARASAAQGGAALPPRGGSGAPGHAGITPLRVPPPSRPGPPPALAAIGYLPAPLGPPAGSMPAAGRGPAAPTAPAIATATGAAPVATGSAPIAAARFAAVVLPSGGAATPVRGPNWDHLPAHGPFNPGADPVYVLDYNDGTTMIPGAVQFATLGGSVDLRAQVSGAAVSSYSWDTTGLTMATGIAGTGTYDLTFQWTTNNPGAAANNSVTLTVDEANGTVVTQTYDFLVPQGSTGGGSGGSGGGTVTWPASFAPDQVLPSAPQFAGHSAAVDANSGALNTAIALPAYSPNIPGLALGYDSLAADPRPIIVAHYPINPAAPEPTNVAAQLTFNGASGSTYYYDTSGFNPGDILQVSQQANATGLASGRYAYSLTMTPSGGSATTDTGTATVIDDASSPLGDGWTVGGLERILSASGGLIVDLGQGSSLWFAANGSGGYTSPPGDFSTLAAASGGWTRTLTDGTVLAFNASGQETSEADRNGNTTAFAYNTSGALTTITDPYGKVTTLAYSGGLLSTITDPAGRVATFTHSGNDLTSVQLPDGSTWSYAYDSAGRLTGITDPNAHTVTAAYDAAERVATLTRPDGTTATYTNAQEQGWTNSGTVGSPAMAVQLAQVLGSYTDPNGHTTTLRPDWRGMGLTDVQADPLGNVSTFDRDANGLATIAIDPVNRVTQYAYDGKGNLTQVTYPDLNTDSYGAYNAFAEPASHTDANGHTTSFTYDGHGNLTVIQDALDHLTTMTYTATGKLATSEDANGHTTSFAYDSQDRLTTTTYPGGATRLVAYDSQGDATTLTDERGSVTVNRYDAMDRLTGTTDALGDLVTYVYDAAGNLLAVQQPLNRTTSYAYDAMDRVTTITDPLGHATVDRYDAAGNLLTVTDPMGRITTYGYDADNRPTTVTDPLGNTTTTAYDAAGEVTQVTDPMGRITAHTYNARGWVATTTDPLGHTTTFSYTPTGQPAGVQVPVSGGAGSEMLVSYGYDAIDRQITLQDALGHITTTVYDAVGNTIATIDANSNQTTYAYDARNRPIATTDPLGHTTSYGYDAAGNRITVTDPLGHTTTTAYDALDRATTITDARGGQTLLLYDSGGRPIAEVDASGNRTTFAYDAADRLTTQVNPNGATATFVYDADGELIDQTNFDGRRTTFAYDSGGRKTGETWVGASPVEAIRYTYDADGELTGVSDPNATLTFTYDSGGRQLTAATSGPAGQPDVTLTSGYDPSNNRISLADSLPSQGVTTFSYDPAFRLTTIAQSLGGAAGPQVVYGYDPANRLTSVARTDAGGSTAVTTSFSYDNANRVTAITHQAVTTTGSGSGGTTTTTTALASYTYGYDAADRLTAETNAEGAVSYTYDATNELTGVTGARTESYGYDLTGNRDTGGYATGSGNELTAAPGYTYTYDNQGNLTSKTQASTGDVWTYSYDYRNRLTGVTETSSSGGVLAQATYTYDPLDRRIGADDNGSQTWTVYDGQDPYADFNASGTLQERYLYGPATDAILARTGANGSTAWYMTDRLGSVRDVVDSSGAVVDHIAYDSYGMVLSETNPGVGDRFKYTGRELDTATGDYYYRSRYYDPAVGRFIQRDPLGFGGGDTDLYRYVHNGPTDFVDPTGDTAGKVTKTKNSGGGYDIKIELPITIYGPGASGGVGKTIEKGIGGILSGPTSSGGNTVTVVPIVTIGTQPTGLNPVYIGGPGTRPYVTPGNMYGSGGVDSGNWPSNITEWEAAHEATHLLWYKDKYWDSGGVSIPYPGYEKHISGGYGGSPQVKDPYGQTMIDQLYKDYNNDDKNYKEQVETR